MIGRSGFDTPTVAGSVRQLAPELMFPNDAPPVTTTKETDVYSFSMVALEVRDLLFRLGIFLGNLSGRVDYVHAIYFGLMIFSSYPMITYFINFYQILTEKEPFFSVHSDTNILLKVLAGERPERSSYPSATFTDSMWELLVDCWDRNPENRPDMGTVVRRLEDM